jgi:UDP-glucose 4-epimerase
MGYIIRELFNGRSPILHSTGNQERDFVFVDDLIDLAVIVQKADSFDVVNVSTGTTVTINTICQKITDVMMSDIRPKYEEVAHFWASYPELYSEPYPISTEIMEHEVLKYTCLSNKHAYQAYGWRPLTTLDVCIRKTVEFTCKALEKAKDSL